MKTESSSFHKVLAQEGIRLVPTYARETFRKFVQRDELRLPRMTFNNFRGYPIRTLTDKEYNALRTKRQ